MHSFGGDNNLALFHLWGKELYQNVKVYKCFVQNCLKISLSVFISLKMYGNSSNDQFLGEKSKKSYKY